MRVTVMGAGAWGTALGLVLHANGHRVTLWSHTPARLEEIRNTGENSRLKGVRLPGDWILEAGLERAVAGAEFVVMAVPSRAFREVAGGLGGYDGVVVSVTKGIEYDTGLTMCGVLKEAVPGSVRVALSGPTMALEVGRGLPAAIVVASEDGVAAERTQTLFHRPTFRVYTSRDVMGVEMGGALKNVVALAAGVGDGLGYGDNSKAALLTRGIVEMRRLGVTCGAQAETFSGLSGLGDLTLTCYSRLSRNRRLGERLGRGESLESVLGTTEAVAEGYPTARAAYRLARELGVEAPIIEGVHSMLYEGKDLKTAVRELIGRETKAEDAL